MINQMSHDVASTSIYCFFEIFFPENAILGFQKKFGNGKVKKPKKLLTGLRKRLGGFFGLAGR